MARGYDTLYCMRRLLTAIFVLFALTGHAEYASAPPPRKIVPPKLSFSRPWFGQASWYGDHWRGHKTACGQLFDPDKLTVAHPILPCGTWVRVTSVRTQRSEFAKVTDRGPYEEGREIDVSERVAKRIGLRHYGVERVKLEIVREADGKAHPPMEYYVSKKELDK